MLHAWIHNSIVMRYVMVFITVPQWVSRCHITTIFRGGAKGGKTLGKERNPNTGSKKFQIDPNSIFECIWMFQIDPKGIQKFQIHPNRFIQKTIQKHPNRVPNDLELLNEFF